MNPMHDPGASGNDPSPAPQATGKTGHWNPAWEEPVWFPEWRRLLDLEPMDAAVRARFGGRSYGLRLRLP